MKTITAIKKLEKVSKKVERTGNRIEATFIDSKNEEIVLTFHDQDDEAIVISTKPKSLENDSMSDLFHDTFHRSIKAAIEFINN